MQSSDDANIHEQFLYRKVKQISDEIKVLDIDPMHLGGKSIRSNTSSLGINTEKALTYTYIDAETAETSLLLIASIDRWT